MFDGRRAQGTRRCAIIRLSIPLRTPDDATTRRHRPCKQPPRSCHPVGEGVVRLAGPRPCISAALQMSE
jgi:hypothetical protein